MKKINSLKKKFEKDFIGGGGRFPANFPIHTNAGKIWDFIHSAVEEARIEERELCPRGALYLEGYDDGKKAERKQLEREIEMLIVEELLIANKEGQPTSRLASLAVKIKNLFHKKQTKRVSI